ncbi:hypothetical protein WOLCODRAFT_126457, partial [Wolfiporia cocos MD-104 SS10]
MFEHFITLDREFTYVWRYRMTGPTVLLLLNRYILVISAFANTLSPIRWTTLICASCEVVNLLSGIATILSFAIAAIFTALRIYAITGGMWHIALLIFLAGLVPFPVNIYVYASQSYAHMTFVSGIPVCEFYSFLSSREWH